MSEAEPGSGDSNPSEPRGGARDFSAVQGFQLVEAEDRNAGDDPSWPDALRLELEARAARFHQAVDSSIMLSNDGAIRWLGDPVARLSAGPDALNPGALILADPSLPEAARDLVRTRVELWIAATTRRVLGPLFALEALQEGPENVRDLARKVARSLGILEREPLRAEIRALSQNDRAELRKQGVRFGAYYLFVPALIKPAARTLALQLWSLRAPGDAGELLRALAPIAASGRTSLALDAGISHEGYRVAGYRQCGERAVRVDIVERLGGMIRAAIAGEPPGGGPEGPGRLENRPAFRGFVASGQMTSLTGCSGESFASILRSMGFRPVEMKRSEFLAAVGSREQPAPPAPEDAQTVTTGDAALARETSEAAAAEDAVGDPPPARDTSEAVASEEPTVDEAEAGDPPPARDMNEAAASEEPAVDEAEAGDPPPARETSEAAASEAPTADEGEAGGPPPASDMNEAAAPGEEAAASAPPPDAAPSAPADLEAAQGVAGAGDVEMIVVWRPDHRRSAPPRRPTRMKPPRGATPSRPGAGDQGPRRPAEAERVNTRRRDAGKEDRRHPPGADRPGPEASEKHRQRANDRDMRANSAAGAQPRAKVDPNSPFAKLLELRPLLENQANKRP